MDVRDWVYIANFYRSRKFLIFSCFFGWGWLSSRSSESFELNAKGYSSSLDTSYFLVHYNEAILGEIIRTKLFWNFVFHYCICHLRFCEDKMVFIGGFSEDSIFVRCWCFWDWTAFWTGLPWFLLCCLEKMVKISREKRTLGSWGMMRTLTTFQRFFILSMCYRYVILRVARVLLSESLLSANLAAILGLWKFGRIVGIRRSHIHTSFCRK